MSSVHSMRELVGIHHTKTGSPVMVVVSHSKEILFHVQSVNLIYVLIAMLSLLYKKVINAITILYLKNPKLIESQ